MLPVFPGLPLSLVRKVFFRTARSRQGRAEGAAKQPLDGEDRSEMIDKEGKEGRTRFDF